MRLHGIGRGGNSPQEARAVHRPRSAGKGRKSGRLSRGLYVDSFDLRRPRRRCRRKPWKMRCGSRKKNIARFPPCWRRRRRSPTPSSTSREGWPSSAARLLLYRECGPAVGYLGDARSRGVHRASAAGLSLGASLKKDRSADPVAKPCNSVAGCAVAGAAGAQRSVRAARSRARPGAVLPAGNSGSRGFELFLLPRDSTDERSDGHHPAIHSAGLGAALYGGTRSATAVVAEKRGGGTGGGRLRAGGRLCRLGRLPHGCNRSHGRTAGCIFLCVL